MNRKMIYPLATVFLTGALIISTGCSEPLSKREQGGLIGGGIGAGTGAIIGSTVGHAAVGALIGGPGGAHRWRIDWRSAYVPGSAAG